MFNRVKIILYDCYDFFIIVFKSMLHIFLLLRGVLDRAFDVKFIDTKGEERVATVVAHWIV